jgi:hypothetical protein
MKKLTPKQVALVERLRGGKVLIAYARPGREDAGDEWFIEAPYSDEDGRTVNGLFSRGLLRSDGDGMYVLIERGADE